MCLVKPPAAPLEAAALESFRASGIRIIAGNLMDPGVSSDPAPPVDVVFHLAANIDTDAPEDFLRVNHIGTEQLLAWLQPISNGVRIVHASSVAVHDRDRQPTGPIVETSPCVARTAYGRTKLLGEEIIRRQSTADGYSWTILRLPTVYGPDQKKDGLFDKLIRLASTGALLGRIDWPGRTSIIHVDDVAAVMIELAGCPEAAGEIYCVASDEALTVGDLSRRIARVSGHPLEPIAIPGPLLSALQRLVWNRVAAGLIPHPARLAFWRLSLIVSDGFWFDTTKFRRVYTKPLKTVEQGLQEITPPARSAEKTSA